MEKESVLARVNDGPSIRTSERRWRMRSPETSKQLCVTLFA
jgi:hypothetical protein